MSVFVVIIVVMRIRNNESRNYIRRIANLDIRSQGTSEKQRICAGGVIFG